MPGDATDTQACRRRAPRFRLDQGPSGFIQFDLRDGSRWMLVVTEISAGGIRFKVNDGRPALSPGTRIDTATVQVGDVRFNGSVRVVHVTQDSAGGAFCGGVFTPEAEANKRMMTVLLGALENRASSSSGDVKLH